MNELADGSKDVIFSKKLVYRSLKLDLSSAILADEDFVPNADFECLTVAVRILRAAAEGNNFSLLGFFFCGVRDNNPIPRLFFILENFDEDTIS